MKERDESRLMVVDRAKATISHHRFQDIEHHLKPGDALVMNDSRVIPARLSAVKLETGAKIELFLLEEISRNEWWVMLKPGKRVKPGVQLTLRQRTGGLTNIAAELLEKNKEGHGRVRFNLQENILDRLDELGETPLPPYILRIPDAIDSSRYQTVYAAQDGSVAAPTAGLHFTNSFLQQIRRQGVKTACVTLHVGHGTFAPVKVETIEDHVMHHESFHLNEFTVNAINDVKTNGGKILAVGTTTMRVLESVYRSYGNPLQPTDGRTDIFIKPPCDFGVVDHLLTNFHLPQSTLLMLISAFAAPGKVEEGRELVMKAYHEAIRERYRFFSYGDAMLLL